MDHASEYSRKLVFAQEAVRGAVRHHASSPRNLDGFLGQEEEDEMYPMVFPGMAHAATCDLSRKDFACGNGVGDRKLNDQELCNYEQVLDGARTGALPCWRSSWPT